MLLYCIGQTLILFAFENFAPLYLYYASAGYQTNLIKRHLIQHTHTLLPRPGTATSVSRRTGKRLAPRFSRGGEREKERKGERDDVKRV